LEQQCSYLELRTFTITETEEGEEKEVDATICLSLEEARRLFQGQNFLVKEILELNKKLKEDIAMLDKTFKERSLCDKQSMQKGSAIEMGEVEEESDSDS